MIPPLPTLPLVPKTKDATLPSQSVRAKFTKRLDEILREAGKYRCEVLGAKGNEHSGDVVGVFAVSP